MNVHAHDWRPVPLRCGLYVCGCGANGRRRANGDLRELRKPHAVERSISARNRTTRGGGLVPALPTLDEQERR